MVNSITEPPPPPSPRTSKDSSAPLERHCIDFGGAKRMQPATVVYGEGEPGFRRAWSLARSRGDELVVRGTGHSCDGQSLTRSVLLENSSGATQPRLMRDGLVKLPSGMRWATAEQWLNHRGLALPVLPDHLDMSVGGTLSAGGIGLTSIEYGLLADQVDRLRLLDGHGQAIWCSRHHQAELFRFALGGLGQVGFIDAAVLHAVRYRQNANLRRIYHESLDDLARFAVEVSDRPGIQHYCGHATRSSAASEFGTFGDDDPTKEPPPPESAAAETPTTTVPDFPFVLHQRRQKWNDAFIDHLRMWTNYTFTSQGLRKFLSILSQHWSAPPLNRCLSALTVFILHRPPKATAFAFAPILPGQTVTYSIGLYFMVPRWNPILVATARQALRTLLGHCCSLGGKPYLYGVNELDKHTNHRLYGTDTERLHVLRREHALESLNPRSLPGQTQTNFRTSE